MKSNIGGMLGLAVIIGWFGVTIPRDITAHIDARFDELRKDPVHQFMLKKVEECK